MSDKFYCFQLDCALSALSAAESANWDATSAIYLSTVARYCASIRPVNPVLTSAVSLAHSLSAELHPRGIRVNGLSPGPTETPALGKLGLPTEEEQALRCEIRALVPIGRMGTTLGCVP